MNLFELFVKVGVDDQASGKLGEIGQKLGNGLKTAAKIGTAAVGVAAAGITALTTAAVKNYAEYEQLVGGVETLFGESADKVKQYASEAFRTAGLSANEYMSTVTSFSASLLQSLGGDTEAAAEYANQALTDMSDNANKMGTSMEMIQNAYQGFAKANYTMLDNLKLGYGGTQSEMQRLIADAAELSDTVDAQDMSFANIVKAINVVQTEMGITGTTAKEAGATIAGSVGAMKSAWSNLITGLADGNADIGKLVDNLVTTIVGDGTESNLGVLGNVMPAVKTALNGAGKLVKTIFPRILKEVPKLIKDYLPTLAKSAMSMVSQLASGIKDALPEILKVAGDLLTEFATGIADHIPDLVDSATQLINDFADFLFGNDNLNTLLGAAIDIVISIGRGIVDNLPQLISAAANFISELVNYLFTEKNLTTLFNGALDLVIALAGSIIDNLPELLGAAGQIVETIINKIFETDWIEVGKKIISGIAAGLRQSSLGRLLMGNALNAENILADVLSDNPEAAAKFGDLLSDWGLEGFAEGAAYETYVTPYFNSPQTHEVGSGASHGVGDVNVTVYSAPYASAEAVAAEAARRVSNALNEGAWGY